MGDANGTANPFSEGQSRRPKRNDDALNQQTGDNFTVLEKVRTAQESDEQQHQQQFENGLDASATPQRQDHAGTEEHLVLPARLEEVQRLDPKTSQLTGQLGKGADGKDDAAGDPYAVENIYAPTAAEKAKSKVIGGPSENAEAEAIRHMDND